MKKILKKATVAEKTKIISSNLLTFPKITQNLFFFVFSCLHDVLSNGSGLRFIGFCLIFYGMFNQNDRKCLLLDYYKL